MVTARWAWRDLRRHLVQIVSIGFVVAIGTGIYAGLGSTGHWRTQSNDASFAALHLHDLRVSLQLGTFAPEGSLSAAAAGIAHASDLAVVAERLVVDSQVDASDASDTVLVGARLVAAAGLASGQGGAAVDTVWLAHGDRPAVGDDAALLEAKFADYYGLAASGTVTLAGSIPVRYTGLGVAPEDFSVTAQRGSVLAEADLATLYVDLDTGQRLTGRQNSVNDLVVTLRPGADRDVIARELITAVGALGVVSPVVITRDETEAYRILYDDIETDQQMWNILSALVLGAAALAAVNLIGRVVEAQHRDIGIGMALGVPRWQLGIRPALIGVEVGIVGTLAGIGVGVLVGSLMQGLLESLLPLPVYETPFQYGVYARGVVIGLVPPLIASIVPVWRAVRVEPAEAMRSGYLAPRGGRLGPWSAWLRLPGSSLLQMPLRNTLRTPRRTVLTALGVGAAITALVAVMGLLDSFTATIDRGVAEVTKGDPDRVAITLTGLTSRADPTVAAIATSPTVGAWTAGLRVPVTAQAESDAGQPLDLLVEVIDFDHALWTPSTGSIALDDAAAGIVLAQKAADDLGVEVGDEVVVTHPRLADGRYTMSDTVVTVSALHPDPIRSLAYLDQRAAVAFGMGDLVNTVQAVPTAGYDSSDLQRAVFGLPGVSSAQPVTRLGEVFDEVLHRFTGFLVITAGSVLALGVLIGMNATRIGIEERRREHATMLAFGVPLWAVVAQVVAEAALVGIAATGIGLVGGYLMLGWILDALARRTLPDIGVILQVGGSTVWIAAAVGVVALSISPLLLVRRIARMDLPDTLRLVE
jgi:putative ABC transport system permease protein